MSNRELRSTQLKELLAQRSLSHVELMHFAWFLLETDAYLQELVAGEKAFLDSLDEATLAEWHSDKTAEFDPHTYFAMRTSYSHVIYLASLIEIALEKACERLAKIVRNAQFEINELKGDKWTIRKKYLERYGHFVLPSSLWKNLMKLVTLRNFIVHDNGNLSKLGQADLLLLSTMDQLDLSGDNVQIHYKFWGDIVPLVDQLMSAVDEGVASAAQRGLAPITTSGLDAGRT